jgi:hypothetical protein
VVVAVTIVDGVVVIIHDPVVDIVDGVVVIIHDPVVDTVAVVPICTREVISVNNFSFSCYYLEH